MSLGMKLSKILCAGAIGIAGLMGLVFLLDLLIKVPFDRFSWSTDVMIVTATALIIWNGWETWSDL